MQSLLIANAPNGLRAMSMLSQSDAVQTRVRAEEVLERKGHGTRRAGELAGHFAAMLQALNGVDGSTVSAADSANPEEPAGTAQPRLGIGAVSVFAQSSDNGVAAGTAADGTKAAVDSALGASAPADFRWLTTLLTQNDAA